MSIPVHSLTERAGRINEIIHQVDDFQDKCVIVSESVNTLIKECKPDQRKMLQDIINRNFEV